MLPAPPKIMCCPKCEQRFLQHELMSGNTFGASFYSDGKMEAPMLPEFPQFSRCPSCGTFFWVNDLKCQGVTNFGDCSYPDIEELTIAEIALFLECGPVRKPDEELFVRVKLWHAFGDRVRMGSGDKMFESPEEQALWEGNLRRILELHPEEKLLIAEIHRQLGEFDEAIQILDEVLAEKKESLTIAAEMKAHCERKNRQVFRFEEDE